MLRLYTTLALLAVISVASEAAESTERRTPTYVDCRPDGVTLFPGGIQVAWEDLIEKPDNAVHQILGEAYTNSTSQYVVVLVHPGAIKFYRVVRNFISQHKVISAYEPVDAAFDTARDERVRNRTFRPVPGSISTNMSPAYFECRQNQLFCVDKEGFESQTTKLLAGLNPKRGGIGVQDFLKAVQTNAISNAYYRVDSRYLLVGVTALLPREDARGEGLNELSGPETKFAQLLTQFDRHQRYLSFWVRDDSFPVLRRARGLAEEGGFQTAWEMLPADEPIRFVPPSASRVLPAPGSGADQ